MTPAEQQKDGSFEVGGASYTKDLSYGRVVGGWRAGGKFAELRQVRGFFWGFDGHVRMYVCMYIYIDIILYSTILYYTILYYIVLH